MKSLLHHVRKAVRFTVVYCALINAGFLFQPTASAQLIRADGAITEVGDVTTTDSQNFKVVGGTQLGSSLFHGFDTFSVPTNGSVTFENAADVANIITRVTGGQGSNIDGLITTYGTETNLILLNREGITFGPNAQLQIGGSFLASTAESLRFTNGTEFAIETTTLDPLLSISTPIGLQLTEASGSISVFDSGYTLLPGSAIPLVTLDSSSSLRVGPSRHLALVANGIIFDGGVVAAPGGHLSLGSVTEGLVGFDIHNWRFDYSEIQRFSDMEFAARSLIDTSSLLFDAVAQPYSLSTRGGSIHLQGENITFQAASRALIQNYGEQAAGDIRVIANNTLALVGESATGEYGSSLVTSNFGGGGGHIDVVAPRLLLTGNTAIGVDNFAIAPGGNVNIEATETVRVDSNQEAIPDYGQLFVNSYGPGTSGEFSLSTEDLIISGYGIRSQVAGTGSGGLVSVEAERIYIENEGSIAASTFGPGLGGTVNVEAHHIALKNGGNIAASTTSSGQGGNVEVTADTIDIQGVNLTSFLPSTITAPTVSTGNAGDVIVKARQISLTEGGRIDSSALAEGDSGAVNVYASESLTVDGTVPGTDVPSWIVSSANIAKEELRGFFAAIGIILPSIPSGNSGSVAIEAPSVIVTNGAEITVRNDGTGDAGNLLLSADSVYVGDRSGITASTRQGNGGNLIVNSRGPLLLRRGSHLSAEAGGTGNGGNVTLRAPAVLALENSDITASAIQGNGGSIQIDAGAILGTQFREQLTAESDITASSQFGTSGEVDINRIEGSPDAGTVELPNSPVDSSDQIAVGCASENNNFAATGRGGLPPNPTNQLSSHRIWSDVRAANLANESSADTAISVSTSEAGIVEASSWIRENGEVALISSAPQLVKIGAARCLSAS